VQSHLPPPPALGDGCTYIGGDMAKRKVRYRYVRRRARRVTSGMRSFGAGGLLGSMIDGMITGLVQSYVPNDALGGYADSLVPIAVGYFRRNKTLQTIGAYQLGVKIASNIGAPKTSIGSSYNY